MVAIDIDKHYYRDIHIDNLTFEIWLFQLLQLPIKGEAFGWNYFLGNCMTKLYKDPNEANVAIEGVGEA